MPVGLLKLAEVPSPSANPAAVDPARVVTVLEGVILRIKLFVVSATYTFSDASTVREMGPLKLAADPMPLVDPAVAEPANDVTVNAGADAAWLVVACNNSPRATNSPGQLDIEIPQQDTFLSFGSQLGEELARVFIFPVHFKSGSQRVEAIKQAEEPQLLLRLFVSTTINAITASILAHLNISITRWTVGVIWYCCWGALVVSNSKKIGRLRIP